MINKLYLTTVLVFCLGFQVYVVSAQDPDIDTTLQPEIPETTTRDDGIDLIPTLPTEDEEFEEDEEVTDENTQGREYTTTTTRTTTTARPTTTRTTTRRPTTTRPRVCRDQPNPRTGRNDCARFRNFCGDRRFEALLRQNCPLTCRFCRRPAPGGNINNRNGCTEATICRNFARSCNLRSANQLRRRCPVTCNTCSSTNRG